MAVPEAEPQVEFISALDDAYLRLACFQTIAGLPIRDQNVTVIVAAQALYNWVMECEEPTSDEVELGATTGESSCTRKH